MFGHDVDAPEPLTPRDPVGGRSRAVPAFGEFVQGVKGDSDSRLGLIAPSCSRR